MKTLLFSIVIFLPLTGFAANLSESDCQMIGLSSGSAMNNRIKGASKDKLKPSLPSLEQQEDKRDSKEYLKLLAMHNTLDEIYSHKPLDATAFMVYKAESCIRKLKGGNVIPYDSAYPDLKACVEDRAKKDLIECSMKAAGAKDNK